jgi:hypothetical protein
VRLVAVRFVALEGEISTIRLLGQEAPLVMMRDAMGLTVTLPAPKPGSAKAPFVLEVVMGC